MSPAAASLTAGTPLLMEQGARMETAAVGSRSTRRKADGKVERLHEGVRDSASHDLAMASFGRA